MNTGYIVSERFSKPGETPRDTIQKAVQMWLANELKSEK